MTSMNTTQRVVIRGLATMAGAPMRKQASVRRKWLEESDLTKLCSLAKKALHSQPKK
jgi:hypothetical protein